MGPAGIASQIRPVSLRRVGAVRAKPGNRFAPRGDNGAHPFGKWIAGIGTQEIVIPLHGVAFEYRGKDSFWKWVQTVAGNLWRDFWRRHERDRKLGLLGRGDLGAGEDRPPALTEVAPSSGETPTQIVRFRELAKAEQECIDKLPKQMRDVYVSRRQLDLSFAEISTKTGIANEATLRSHYMRARDRVRECLGSKLDEIGARINGWQ